MARKNLLDAGTTPTDRVPASARHPAAATPQRGAVAAIRNNLREMNTRSIQELDSSLVEDGGLRDRLAGEEGLEELVQSIRDHGQQVPILVRPHPEKGGQYVVVYGRRRLRAIRRLQIPVKAMIRTMTDEEAALAQGQENNVRKDPSFIEKALFAGQLEEAGYAPSVIEDALNTQKTHIAHMRLVRRTFPVELIERIGAAPGIGWKRWYGLAREINDRGLAAESLHPEPFGAALTSDERFLAYAKSLNTLNKTAAPPSAPDSVRADDGTPIARIAGTDRKLAISAIGSVPESASFVRWLRRHGDETLRRLHADWRESQGG